MSELTGNNLVEKSKALVWAKFTDYTAGELRLLEVYLSRINPRDPESSNVTFTLAEYCRLLGLKLNSKTLRSQVKHFLSNVVSVPLNADESEYVMYPLFTKAEVRYKRGTLSYEVSINCNPDLRPVFFDIAKSGYVKYRLRYTIGMKQQASILMYSMIRDWMNRSLSENKIGLKQLREHLGANDASYDDFRALRRRVIEPAVDEICRVSDILVSFDKVCVGRKVVAVEFKFGYKSKEITVDAQSAEVQTEDKKYKSGYENADWGDAVQEIEVKQCISIARGVEKRLKVEYPTLRKDKEKDAAANIVRNAYEQAVRDNPEVMNPVAYLRTTIKESPLSKFATFDFSYIE